VQKIEIQHAKKKAQQTKPMIYHGVAPMQKPAIPIITIAM
jgi:hypothetical protein